MPEAAVEYLAAQTKAAPSAWAEYDWQGRTIKYHRAEIRALWGFREATAEDGEDLTHWLCHHVLTYERHPARILELALGRLRELKIEPPTAERLDRLIRSALHTFEEEFRAELIRQALSGDEGAAQLAAGAVLAGNGPRFAARSS